MAGVRSAETALRIARAGPARPQFVCRTCRQHAQRQFHTSPVVLEENKPWHERMLESVFGSRKKQAEEKQREERESKRIEKLLEEGGTQSKQVFFDGKVWDVAPFIDRALDPQYEKASDWTGLEVIGGDGWVKKQQDKGTPYVGFASVPKKELSSDQWQRLVLLTAIEALALRSDNRPLSQLSNPRVGSFHDVLLSNQVTLSETKVKFKHRAAERAVLDTISETSELVQPPQPSEPDLASSEQESVEPELPERVEAKPELSLDTSFPIPKGAETLSLSDPTLKLAITKRLFQVTGKRVPDFKLNQVTTLSQLSELLSVKPTPKKLSQHPALQQTISEIPNVRIVSRKTSEKEKEVGRWKLIVDELNKCDLPIHGTRRPAEKRYIPGFESPPPAGVNPPRRKQALV